MITYQNGLNLAYWLYRVHPQLYNRVVSLAKQSGLSGLGQDVTTSDSGTTTTFDTSDDSSIPTITVVGTSAVSPDLTNLATPNLTTVSVDAATNMTTPNFTAATAAPIAPPAAGPSSSSSLLSSVGSGLASAGSFLASATGLTALTNLATAYYKASTPQAATINTQIARVANGVNPAPITYGINSAGQVVPILQSAQTAGVGLTSQTLANLVPSSLTPYLLPIGIGLVLLFAFGSGKKR